LAGGGSEWKRDFSLLWTGSAASQLGNTTTILAAPLLALSLTGSPIFAGWVTAVATLPRILLLLPVGVLVDRWDRLRVLSASTVIRIVLAGVLIATLFLFDGIEAVLLLVVLLQGICVVFFSTAETAAIPWLVPEPEIHGAMAKSESRTHLATLIGRPAGLYLFELHRALPFVTELVTSVMALVLLRGMRRRKARDTPREGTMSWGAFARDLGAGLKFVRDDTFLGTTLVVCALANFFFQTLALVLVMLAYEQLMPNWALALLVAASGLGGLLGSVWALKLSHGGRDPKNTIIFSLWWWLVMVGALPFADLGPAMSIAVLLPVAQGGIGFFGAHLNIALALYQASHVPEKMLGRVTGIGRFISGGAVPLGALASGYVIAGLGRQTALITVMVVVAVLALTFTVMWSSWVQARCKAVAQGVQVLLKHAFHLFPLDALLRNGARVAERLVHLMGECLKLVMARRVAHGAEAADADGGGQVFLANRSHLRGQVLAVEPGVAVGSHVQRDPDSQSEVQHRGLRLEQGIP
jgi:MFS family permease